MKSHMGLRPAVPATLGPPVRRRPLTEHRASGTDPQPVRQPHRGNLGLARLSLQPRTSDSAVGAGAERCLHIPATCDDGAGGGWEGAEAGERVPLVT